MPSTKIIRTLVYVGIGLIGGTGIGAGIGAAWDAWHYGPDGFNGNGLDRDGYDREGYNSKGYDRDGYDKNGRDRRGFDKDGYDVNGYDRRHRDREGYDPRGFDQDGFNRAGYDRSGYSRDGFNEHGEDRNHSVRRHYDFEVDEMNELLQKAWSFKGKHDYESAVTPARKALECGIQNVYYHWYGKPERLPIMRDQIKKCLPHLGDDMCDRLVGVWKITSNSSHYQGGKERPLRDGDVHFCLKTLEELRDVLALYGTRVSH